MAKEMGKHPDSIDSNFSLNGGNSGQAAGKLEGLGNVGSTEQNTPLLNATDIGGISEEPRFGKSYVSMFIDDTSIKFLKIKKDVITRWVDIPLEPGLVNDGVINSPDVVADKIRTYIQGQKIDSDQIIVGFSGLHCLSRVMQMPKVSDKKVIDEAVRYEAANNLPVPVENVYLAWQAIKSAGEELNVFFVAYTRDIVDSLVNTLQKAGIRRGLMDLAPLAITNVVDQKTAAVIDVRNSGLDIVVMIDGVPQLIRSLPLPKEKSLAEKLPVIRDEMERTIKFYTNEKPQITNGVLPVFISGIVQDDPDIYKTLIESLSFSVSPAVAPLPYPQGLDPAHYAVNIGLILKKMGINGAAAVSQVNLNALPQIYRPQPFHMTTALGVSGTIFAVAVVIAGVFFVKSASNEVDSLRTRIATVNTSLTHKLSQQKTLTESISSLQKQLDESQAALDAFYDAQKSVGTQQDIVNGDLAVTSANLEANGIVLVDLRHDGEKLTITGIAPGEAEILSYAGILKDSGRYSSVNVTDISQEKDQGLKFILSLKAKE